MNVKHSFVVAGTGIALGLLAIVNVAGATNSWNGYHWARTANPFTLKLGNNTSGTWTQLLSTVSSDWSQSAVLDTTVVAGGTNPKPCKATTGRVEVCNSSYGNTGWLGVAQIWISGKHIVKGAVKNNDYYFGSSSYAYNNEAEKRHVICQEVGHTLGLDHQSTNGGSLDTCMDYYHNTSNSDLLSTTPNQHDYDELAIIYSHLDSSTTVGATSKSNPAGVNLDSPSEWGKLVRTDAHGQESLFERDLGNGEKLFTFVIWAEPRGNH